MPADGAMPFGLLLHKLATNAMTYGALSQADGGIDVNWGVSRANGKPILNFLWTETGGPPVDSKSSGLAGAVVKHGIPHAKVTRDFKHDGLVCAVELPLGLGGM